jgi:hypothetical protein
VEESGGERREEESGGESKGETRREKRSEREIYRLNFLFAAENNPIAVSVNETNPNLLVTSIVSGQSLKFIIAIKSIEEYDESNVLVGSYLLADYNFTLNQTQIGDNVEYGYSTLVNEAPVSVVISFH